MRSEGDRRLGLGVVVYEAWALSGALLVRKRLAKPAIPAGEPGRIAFALAADGVLIRCRALEDFLHGKPKPKQIRRSDFGVSYTPSTTRSGRRFGHVSERVAHLSWARVSEKLPGFDQTSDEYDRIEEWGIALLSDVMAWISAVEATGLLVSADRHQRYRNLN